MSASTIAAVTAALGSMLASLEPYLGRTSGPRDLLAELGWDLPSDLDDVGLAALDVSDVVSKLTSVNLAIDANVGSVELDASYAELIVAVGAFISKLDNFGAGITAPPDFLAKTNIVAEFTPRLIDYLVTHFLLEKVPFLPQLAMVFGIFEFEQLETDATIFQTRHLRCQVHWGSNSTNF